MNSEYIPTLPPNVIWRMMDDGAVLVSPEVGKVRVLNEVGTAVWQLIDGKKSLGQIEDELLQKYNASREQIREDLYAFLEDLSSRRLIIWKGNDTSGNELING